jgi:hypothetical protein
MTINTDKYTVWPGAEDFRAYGAPYRPTPLPTVHARLFLGQVLATPGAIRLAAEAGRSLPEFTAEYLTRHLRGDWGDICEEDRAANDRACEPETQGRVLSVYDTPGGRLWIITEADRSATTCLAPTEY